MLETLPEDILANIVLFLNYNSINSLNESHSIFKTLLDASKSSIWRLLSYRDFAHPKYFYMTNIQDKVSYLRKKIETDSKNEGVYQEQINQLENDLSNLKNELIIHKSYTNLSQYQLAQYLYWLQLHVNETDKLSLLLKHDNASSKNKKKIFPPAIKDWKLLYLYLIDIYIHQEDQIWAIASQNHNGNGYNLSFKKGDIMIIEDMQDSESIGHSVVTARHLQTDKQGMVKKNKLHIIYQEEEKDSDDSEGDEKST